MSSHSNRSRCHVSAGRGRLSMTGRSALMDRSPLLCASCLVRNIQ